MKTMKVNGYTMQYVEAHERDKYLTDGDREMDLRATTAKLGKSIRGIQHNV